MQTKTSRYGQLAILLLALIQSITLSQAHSAEPQRNKKVLFVLSAHSSGYWLPEVIKPYQDLTDNGYQVEFATPLGAQGKAMAASQLNSRLKKAYRRIESILASPRHLRHIESKDYLAIYFPGGAGPMFDLVDHPEVNRLVKAFHQEDKIIAALCHGPAALTYVTLENGEPLLSGLKITGKSNAEESFWARQRYPFLIEDKFKALGSHYSAAEPKEAHIVYDSPVLTGQNPQSTALLSKELIKLLKNNKGSNI